MKSTNVMACVTKQKTCERLILKGKDLIESDKDKLYVLHVVAEKGMFLDNKDDGQALEYLFSVSKNVGADLTVVRAKDILKAMIIFAKDHDISHLVIGASRKGKGAQDSKFAKKLKKELPKLEIITI